MKLHNTRFRRKWPHGFLKTRQVWGGFSWHAYLCNTSPIFSPVSYILWSQSLPIALHITFSSSSCHSPFMHLLHSEPQRRSSSTMHRAACQRPAQRQRDWFFSTPESLVLTSCQLFYWPYWCLRYLLSRQNQSLSAHTSVQHQINIIPTKLCRASSNHRVGFYSQIFGITFSVGICLKLLCGSDQMSFYYIMLCLQECSGWEIIDLYRLCRKDVWKKDSVRHTPQCQLLLIIYWNQVQHPLAE